MDAHERLAREYIEMEVDETTEHVARALVTNFGYIVPWSECVGWSRDKLRKRAQVALTAMKEMEAV